MEALFSAVAEARARLAQHNAIGQELQAEATAAESALFDHMRDQNILTAQGSGLQASIKTRRDSKIDDAAQVEAALTEMNRREEALKVTLDAAVVKRIAKERGELLPGMVETETVYTELRAKP